MVDDQETICSQIDGTEGFFAVGVVKVLKDPTTPPLPQKGKKETFWYFYYSVLFLFHNSLPFPLI